MATPTSNSIGLTGDSRIDGLVQGSTWQFSGGTRVLTYSFSVNDSAAGSWTDELRNAVQRAFAEWSKVANVIFVESGSGTVFTSSGADIALTPVGADLQAIGAAALGIFPGPAEASALLDGELGYSRSEYPRPEGDIFFDDTLSVFQSGRAHAGGAGFQILLHEIGHALGLKHTSDDGANGRPTFQALGLGAFDNPRYTVMGAQAGDPFGFFHDTTPMLLDILAIQRLYGANMSHNGGNDAYMMRAAPATIWDTGGIDAIDATQGSGNARIDLRPGAVSESTDGSMIAIAYGTTIENASGGSGNDTLIGNDADNVFNGGAGADRLEGGHGNDTYHVWGVFGVDTLVELPGQGTDTVVTQDYLPYTLPANIENLVLTNLASEGIGNELGNSLLGTAYSDTLRGLGGNDYLDGGLDDDMLYGGTGDDTYVVDRTNVSPPVTALHMRGSTGAFLLANTAVNVTPTTGNLTFTLLDDRPDGVVDGVRIDYSDGSNDLHIVYSMRTYSGTGYALTAGEWIQVYQYGPSTPDRPTLNVYGNGMSTAFSTGLSSFTISDMVIDYTSGTPTLTRLHSSFWLDPMGTGSQSVLGTVDLNYTAGVADVDVIVENPDEGNDTVRSPADYALQATVENLTLFGAAAAQGTGNAQANVLTGNGAANMLSGGPGNDRLNGDAGADQLYGESDHDALHGGNDNDLLEGADGNDGLHGDDGHDTLRGGTGYDALYGGAGNDALYGGTEADAMDGGEGYDALYGDAGYDTLSGGSEDDWLAGGAGNDRLHGDAGTDSLYGGADHDGLHGGNDNDLLEGADGNDGLYGDAGHDTLRGEAGYDALAGGAGNDALYGGTEDDALDGGEGYDALYGNEGADTLHGGTESDLLDGGTGADALYGGSDNDALEGDEGDDRLYGEAGHDTLRGEAGEDALFGGPGNDAMYGAAENDLLDGGEGYDALYGDEGADILQGGAASDFLEGGAGHDALYGGGDNDTLEGSDGHDLLYGDAGHDTLRGEAGEDGLFGGDGNDALYGGTQNDILDGGAGYDALNGGSGRDRFDYNAMDAGSDTISDFLPGVYGDILDVHDVLVGYVSGMSNPLDFVQLAQSGDATMVRINADGVGTDFALLATLEGVTGASLSEMLAHGNLLL